MNYTAEELVNKLKQEENIAISVRTLNYYAYDKKMFPNLSKGKCSFTDEEYELLKRISYLKDKTSMTLDKIKDCITNEEEYSKQVDNVISDSVTRSRSYSVTTGETYSATTSDKPMTISMRNSLTSQETFINSVSTELPKNNFNESKSFNDYINNSSNDFYASSCSPNLETDCNCTAYSDDNSIATNQISSTCICTSTSTIGDFNNGNTSAKDILPQSYIVPATPNMEKKQQFKEQDTTVRINKDVTITVSSNVSRERLIEIINFINQK